LALNADWRDTVRGAYNATVNGARNAYNTAATGVRNAYNATATAVTGAAADFMSKGRDILQRMNIIECQPQPIVNCPGNNRPLRQIRQPVPNQCT